MIRFVKFFDLCFVILYVQSFDLFKGNVIIYQDIYLYIWLCNWYFNGCFRGFFVLWKFCSDVVLMDII